ncbi:MAG: hypothetical protein AB7V23_16695, partial [Candidatus Nanopelagicales bacterium]
PDPGMLAAMLAKVDAARELGEVWQLVVAWQGDPTSWLRAWDGSLWVPESPPTPFLDREELQRQLVAMARGGDPAAIVVDARSGQGKRTICDFVTQLVRGGEAVDAVVVRELRGEGDNARLEVLEWDLLVALGREDKRRPPLAAEPERIGVAVATALRSHVLLSAITKPLWLVANVVDVAREPGLLRFLDETLRIVQNDADVAKKLRVVLLADEFARLELANLPPVHHQYTLPDVPPEAVTRWLARAVPGLPDALYAIATQQVLDEMAARPVPAGVRLAWLSRLCADALKDLWAAV